MLYQFTLSYFQDGPHAVIGRPCTNEQDAWDDFISKVVDYTWSWMEDEEREELLDEIDNCSDLDRKINREEGGGFADARMHKWG